MQNISNTQTIPANNNLTIQIDAHDWRLLAGSDPIPAVAANAIGLAYSPAFAQARRLTGPLLPAESIESVMVGWAKEDTAWHLGVMISPEAAIERGGRWCGLARWTDLDGQVEASHAETAGRSLATALNKPFQFVPPNGVPAASVQPPSFAGASTLISTATDGQMIPLELAALPNVQMLNPPITMGVWTLSAAANGLIWKHSSGWQRGMLVRAIFYLILAVVFIVLGLAELKTTFAPVQPDWLPYVGFFVAAILLISGLYHLGAVLTANTIVFDTPLKMIRFMRPIHGVTKQIPFEKVTQLLISHMALTQEKIKGEPADSPFSRVLLECWLHIARDLGEKGDFVEIGHVPSEGRVVRAALTLPRRALNLNELDTQAHQAARLIGEAIGVPVVVEDRSQ